MEKKTVFMQITKYFLLVLAVSTTTQVFASNLNFKDLLTVEPTMGAGPVWGASPGMVHYGVSPYYNPGYSYGTYYNPYNNPYYYHPGGAVYGGYTYSGYVGRYNIGGVTVPVYGSPQLIAGDYYGMNVGGAPYQFWRAPSGFYYPWVGGYAYNSYPIYAISPDNNTPRQTLPPVSTVISDLDKYLDSAKKNDKITSGDYQSLRQRASDLLSKEKSLAYEEGGTINPDQEDEIRQDVDELSAEVAHRVQP